MTRAALFLPLAILAACDDDGPRHAAAGGLPAVNAPVGPIPGPGIEPGNAPNPLGDGDAVLAEGRRMFVRFNCAGCHGDHAGGGMGPSLRDPDWIYGSSNHHIFDSIAEGRAHGMPAWGVRLPEQMVWKLVAYIQALGTEREPEPPR